MVPHFLSLLLSVCKLGTVGKTNAVVTLQWTCIPSRGTQNYFKLLHATEIGVKCQPNGSLAVVTFSRTSCLLRNLAPLSVTRIQR